MRPVLDAIPKRVDHIVIALIGVARKPFEISNWPLAAIASQLRVVRSMHKTAWCNSTSVLFDYLIQFFSFI